MGILRRVITANAAPPVLPRGVTILQNPGAHAYVVIRIECLPRGPEPILVITPADLHQADIDGALPSSRYVINACQAACRESKK